MDRLIAISAGGIVLAVIFVGDAQYASIIIIYPIEGYLHVCPIRCQTINIGVVHAEFNVVS